jgi:tripartite-type tricarboxylate transporter receptor subunit TctC
MEESMNKRRCTLASMCLALLATVAVSATFAQQAANFPNRPVRMIVPYAPGGATDITARQLAAKLIEVWGQQVIVDNRAGASGNIALELAARASPDGYTLMVGNVSTNAINETTYASTLPFKPSRALTGVTNLIELPHLWVVSNAVPASTIRQLIDHAKKPGVRLNYASVGVGSYPHLDTVAFLKAAGIDMTHVPYKGGAGPIIPALVGNEVQLCMINMASSIQQIRAGRIKALTTTWPTRRPELPDVPTMAESGFPGIGTNAWNGLFAPAKIAKPVLNRIYTDVVKIMTAAPMQEALGRQFMSVVVNDSPAAFDQFIQREVNKWGAIVRDNHITVE